MIRLVIGHQEIRTCANNLGLGGAAKGKNAGLGGGAGGSILRDVTAETTMALSVPALMG